MTYEDLDLDSLFHEQLDLDASLRDIAAGAGSDSQDCDLQPIPDQERLAPDVPSPAWRNWNPLANSIASAQGIEVGTWPWLLGGMAAWSGSSGEQASYGWNHTHRLSPEFIRAVLANYGHRRAYYTNAPFRQFHYEAASRPHGWTPESAGDQIDGTTTYQSSSGPVKVSGPDAEHLWLTPLFAVMDDPVPIEVETGLGHRISSATAARAMVTLLVSSAVGMVRDRAGGSSQRPYPWTYGDRATGRLLHTIIEGMKRNCLLPEDVQTAALFIRDVALPFYERAPGIHSFGASRPGQFPMGLFNGFNWIVPVCYDAANALLARESTVEWGRRFHALVARWADWAVDMEAALPGRSFAASILHLDDRFRVGENGGPAARIAEFITPNSFQFSFDYSAWSFRSVAVLAEVSGDAALIAARDQIAAQYLGNESKRKWMVGADGNYHQG